MGDKEMGFFFFAGSSRLPHRPSLGEIGRLCHGVRPSLPTMRDAERRCRQWVGLPPICSRSLSATAAVLPGSARLPSAMLAGIISSLGWGHRRRVDLGKMEHRNRCSDGV
ncbi:hypothetical protein ACLOJK_003740 [Asimina triloba]